MSLPDRSKLESLARKTTAEKEQLGLPTSGYFWSSSENTRYDYDAYYVGFNDSHAYTYSYYKYYSGEKALCIGD